MDGNLPALTLIHVLLSLVALGAGFIVLGGLLEGRSRAPATNVFLGTTALTSATGFLFPINGFTPALGVGIVTLAVLVPTMYSLFIRKLAGGSQRVYLIGAVTLVFLNVFVLIAQMFLKVPALRELAPTQREAPFALVQLGALVAFIVLGMRVNARFKSPATTAVT